MKGGISVLPHSKGFRHKTRSTLKKKEVRGIVSSILREYKVDDKVVVDIDPSQVKGMPHRRFQGKVGTIEEIRRRSLVVNVPVGGKVKKVIARLEHIKPHVG